MPTTPCIPQIPSSLHRSGGRPGRIHDERLWLAARRISRLLQRVTRRSRRHSRCEPNACFSAVNLPLTRVILLQAMDGIAQLLITLLVAHAAVSLGLYVASHLPVLPTPFLAASFRPTRTLDYLVTVVSISLYVLTLCAYLVLAPAIAANGWASNVVLPLVIAPAGCVVRYYLSRANPTRWVLGGKRNGGRVTWPIGTGAANLVGCLVLAATYILSRVDLGRAVLSGSACSVSHFSRSFLAMDFGVDSGRGLAPPIRL